MVASKAPAGACPDLEAMPETTATPLHAGSGPIDVRTAPDRYRHWRLRVDDRIATLELDVDESGGLAPGYELKLNSYDLGVDIELADAVQRLRFEHPEVAAVVIRSAQGAGVLRRRQHPHARRIEPCAQGCLLQVHQRDPVRHRGRERTLGPALSLRDRRHRGGRRLRACDGRRLDPPRRRRIERGVAAGGRAPRGAARHRWTGAGGRQAQGAPGSGRLLLHHRGGGARQAGAGVGPGGRDRAFLAFRRSGRGARAGAGGNVRSPGRRTRHPSSRSWSAASRTSASATGTWRPASIARCAPAASASRDRPGPRPRTSTDWWRRAMRSGPSRSPARSKT